ncbi:uncharacterized protein VP01_1088g3 [Puccinia sorghi]|uniref:Uncharacterized protein n=1 Tax=Puccinia sorghi TaxID=27349 RepID=A0A0L6VT59_9BASI|nr:uncharacterized protein VP01_1088g3 [Puccinia sorghi]
MCLPSRQINPVQHSTAPPLHDLIPTASKKPKQALQRTEDDPTFQEQSDDELMQYTLAKLDIHAAEGSEVRISSQDKQFFLEYHEEQQKRLTAKSIARGVSLPMVDALL